METAIFDDWSVTSDIVLNFAIAHLVGPLGRQSVQLTIRRLVPVPLVAVCLLAAGCAVGSNTAINPKTMDLTLTEQAPHIGVTDTGAKGDSPGDTEETYAPLTRDGKPAGHVSGVMITEDMPNDVVGATGSEERLEMLTFNLPDGQIMVGGSAMYPVGQQSMNANEPAVRPVIGGTKAYLGARGELTTTRQSDQTYLQQFHLVDVNPA